MEDKVKELIEEWENDPLAHFMSEMKKSVKDIDINGKPAQIQIVITTDEDEFIEVQ